MAFPNQKSKVGTAVNTAGTQHLIDMAPSGIVAQDALVMWAFTGGTAATHTTPSGWTLLGTSAVGTLRLSVFAKIAAGNENGTQVDIVTSASVLMAAQVVNLGSYRNSGVIQNDVEVAFFQDAAATPNPNPPNLDPANWAAEDTKWYAVCGRQNTHVVSSYPTNYSDGVSTHCNAFGAVVASATRDINASAEDPGTYTWTSSVAAISATIAVRPAQTGVNDRRGQYSFAAMQFPVAPPEAPPDPRRGQYSYVAMEFPDAQRRGQYSAVWMEFPDAPAGSGFPQVADITQTTTQTDGTTFTVNLPATVNSGDLLLLLVSASAMAASANGTATNWTQLRVQENNTNYASYLLGKVADGTEDGGTVVVDFAGQNGSSFAAQVIRITANTWRNSGTLANDVEINSTNNNSGGIDPPALNPTNWDVENTLWIAAGTFGQIDASLVTGAPANYTNFLNTAAGAPQNCAVITARRELAAASEDPGAFTETIGAGNIGQWTIAIRPAAGGGGGGGEETDESSTWLDVSRHTGLKG